MTAVRTLDPITTEIVRSAFSAAADEMNATLIRSAYTPIIYEMKDCSVALLDADHRVLGQSAGLPIFLGNLEICTRLTEEMYGREGWQPGDVWIMNVKDQESRIRGRVEQLLPPAAQHRAVHFEDVG